MNWFTNLCVRFSGCRLVRVRSRNFTSLRVMHRYLKTVYRMLTDKREEDESEKEYWRIHGGE